MLTIGTR